MLISRIIDKLVLASVGTFARELQKVGLGDTSCITIHFYVITLTAVMRCSSYITSSV